MYILMIIVLPYLCSTQTVCLVELRWSFTTSRPNYKFAFSGNRPQSRFACTTVFVSDLTGS